IWGRLLTCLAATLVAPRLPGGKFRERSDMGEPTWGAAGRIPTERRRKDHAKGSQVRRVRRDRRVAGRGGGTSGARGRAGPGPGEGGRPQQQRGGHPPGGGGEELSRDVPIPDGARTARVSAG